MLIQNSIVNADPSQIKIANLQPSMKFAGRFRAFALLLCWMAACTGQAAGQEAEQVRGTAT